MNHEPSKFTSIYIQKLFAEAADRWDLDRIYKKIDSIQQKCGQSQLSPQQKACLRGLLCGYDPAQIASHFPDESYGVVVNQIFRLIRYIEILTGRKCKTIQDQSYIANCLAAAGYQRKENKNEPQIDSQMALRFLEPDTEEMFQGGRRESKAWGTQELQEQRYRRAEALGNQREYERVNARVNANAIAKTPNSESANLVIVDSRSNSLNLIAPEHNALAVVEANDFLPSISLWSQLSGLFIAGSVGVAIALAAFLPYKVTVKAPTVIRPASGIKIVEAETQGTIVDIPVKENQTIRKGDIIATIDNSRLQTEKNLLQSKIQQGQLQLGQINAQINALDNQIRAESDRIQDATEVASAELNRRRREYQDKKITTAAQVEEASANLRLAQQEWQQAQAESRSAEATLKSKLAALNAAKSKSKRYQSISDTGALSQDQLEEVRLLVEQQQQEMLAQTASVERQQRFIERQKQAMQAAKARLQNALAAIDPSNAEVAIASKRITQEQASGKATIANLNREKEVILQQRIEMQKQLERDTREFEQMVNNLSQTIVKAPTNGTLFQLQLSNPGQTVQPGVAIARIAPEETALLVKAFVSAKDISNVRTGQAAQVKISACPYPDYGTLKGTVSQVSPDAMQLNSKNNTEPNANSSSSTNERISYEVTIKPESLSLSQRNNECSLQLGMEGNTDIISQEETVLKFLLRKARLLANF